LGDPLPLLFTSLVLSRFGGVAEDDIIILGFFLELLLEFRREDKDDDSDEDL
jgi:hypothetical protein